MRLRRALELGLPTALVVAGTTCIIPDREIGFAGGPDNEGAVRILFRPPTMEEMDEICNAEQEVADPTFCPAARRSRPPGLVTAGASRPFCICPSGEDNRAIDAFDIYVEDPDVEHDDPKDTLYGVLLLDPDLGLERPTDLIAYRNYLEPCGVANDVTNMPRGLPRTIPSQAREDVPQRLFRLDDGSGRGTIDLCNDNNGAPVEPGLHSLQFMVTDRPFFRPPLLDMAGEPIEIDDEPLLGPQQCGVPDLAAGATYAVANYVFECRLAGEDTDPAGECDCAEG